MFVKIAIIAALILFISRKFFGKSIQPKEKIKDSDIVDAEYTVIDDENPNNK